MRQDGTVRIVGVGGITAGEQVRASLHGAVGSRVLMICFPQGSSCFEAALSCLLTPMFVLYQKMDVCFKGS